MYRALFAALLLAVTVFQGAASLAQSNTGRLTGTVLDAQGGVMPGVTVKVTDNQTKRERVLVADENGNFVIPQVEPGSFTVSATQPSFRTVTFTNVVIEVGREQALRIVMQVGEVVAAVTVEEVLNPVNATTGEVSTTITTRQIMDLPLNGRNPLQLLLTLPGAASNPSQNTSINGQRTAFTNITHDGINVQDAFIRSNATDFAPSRPSVDDSAEITVVSQNATADQGAGGAQVRLVTPRGKSDYHGAVYEFNRNSAVAANSFFNNRSGIARPFRNRNQAGGNFAGPVPGLQDKLFFYFNFEALRDRVTSQESRTILRNDARSGVFTYRDDSGQIRTANLFGLLPTVTGIDPIIAQRFISRLPTVGNAPEIGDGLNTIGYRFNQGSNTSRDQYTGRGDYDFNSRNNVNVIWSWNKEVNQRPDVDTPRGFGAVPVSSQDSVNKRLVAAWRWTPTSRFTNEVRGGTFRSVVPFYRKEEAPAAFLTPGVFSNPEVTFLDQGRNVRTYNFQDNADWVIGRHSLRFGTVLQWDEVDPYNYAAIVPTYTLGTNVNTPTLTATLFPGGISAAQLATANSLMATMGGIVSAGTQSFNLKNQTAKTFEAVPRLEDYRYENYSFYISDQWRLKTSLSINLGLRYELWQPLRLLNGLLLEPVVSEGRSPLETILSPTGSYNYIGGNSGGNNRLYKNDKNNIAPVISAAWSPRGGRTVFRGGFRTSYVNDSILTAVRNAAVGNVGLGTTGVSAINPATNNTALNARVSSLPAIPPPAVQIPRTFADNNGPSFSNFGTVFLVNPEIKTPMIYEYNFTIEHQLPWQMNLEARYVGSRATNLLRSIDYNQIDIRDNGFAADFDRARRNFVANGNPAVGEALTVFPLLAAGGNLANATNRNFLQTGVPADMALNYVQLGQAGTVKFLPNPGTGVANLFSNGSFYNYNALQLELRKRLSSGLYFVGNYTFQKNLTNGIGTSQQLVEPFLDNKTPQLEKTRADYDQTQVFNLSSIYELPFGRNRRFLSGTRSAVNHIIGGWSVNSIVRAASGAPITITDARGTLNRAGRSGRQTPNTALTSSELQKLVGFAENSRGIYMINPFVVNPTTGRASEGFGNTPFAGQVFFNANPGTTGTLARGLINGPSNFTIDMSLLKNTQITEGVRLQIRAEAFNLLNNVNFHLAQTQDIGSVNFGRSTSTAVAARVVQFGARLEF